MLSRMRSAMSLFLLCGKGTSLVSSFSPTLLRSHNISSIVNKAKGRTIKTFRLYTSTSPVESILGRPTWQQTMLRIADPQKSLAFYRDIMGMTHIDTLNFPQWNFCLYFLTTLPQGESYTLTPGTQEAHDYLWSVEGTVLELTHNFGTEDASFKGYHPGNQEKDGFGHVAFNTDDVYAACELMEKAGISFKKKPDEGRYVLVCTYYVFTH